VVREIMEKAFYETYDYSVKRKLDMRKAAVALAVSRVAEAMRLSDLVKSISVSNKKS
jgi:glutamate dehydrogenase/leucine dehydrogenase